MNNCENGPWRAAPRLRAGARGIAIACAWLTLAAASASAARPELFPILHPLVATPAATQAIGAVELDEAVFARTTDGYRDLRLFDDADREVPLLVRVKKRAQTVVRPTRIGIEQTDFTLLPDNRIAFTFHPTNRTDHPVALTLETGQRNFEKDVTVWGRDDAEAWEPVVSNQPIFDYTRYMDVRHLRVPLPGAARRHYRVEIGNITESHPSPFTEIARDRRAGGLFSEVETGTFRREDFRIDAVTVWGEHRFERLTEVVARAYSATNRVVERDAEAQVTTVAFETARVPLTRVALVTPERNFSRLVTLQAQDGKAWRIVARATLSRIQAGSFKRDESTLELAHPSRYAHYRLTIHDHDNPPLAIDGLDVEGEIHEALFYSEPGRRYRLAYGAGGDMPAPRYDIAAVLAATDGAVTTAFRLGAPFVNPGYRPDAGAAWLSGRRLLVAAVVLMVLVLALLIARAIKSMDPPDPPRA